MECIRNILVTGANGFIGKKVTAKLRAKRYNVREFNLSEGFDVRNKEQAMEAVKGIDCVIHLSAALDEGDKKLLKEVNVEGTRNICEACEKEKVKMVFLSSVGVYGNAKEYAEESETELNPETNYEKSKLEAEKIVLGFQETVEVTIIRSALAMGANEWWKKIISMIEKDAPLIGDGSNHFQTIYVDELATAIVFLMERVRESGEIINVAEKEAYSLKEVVGMIREELGMEKEMKTVSEGIALPLSAVNSFIAKLSGKKTLMQPEYIKRLTKNRHYSIKKLESYGWRPMYSTRAAIKETIKGIKLMKEKEAEENEAKN